MRLQRRKRGGRTTTAGARQLALSISTRESKPTKGLPVPTRFEVAEDAFLDGAATATGLTHAELIRRSVRLAKRQYEVLNENYQFLLDLRP